MQHLLGFRCMGYVEYENYCQEVLKQRIADGFLDAAPIFGDIREFNRDYASSYTGMVDLITGGFPCQAFSTAAAGRNMPEKDMWPETSECIEIIQPDFFLGENAQREAVEWAGASLREMGYACKGTEISASDMGADHIRARYWILAHTNNEGKLLGKINAKMEWMPGVRPSVWCSYPNEPGMDDGHSNRMDRFKAIGNMQVPLVAATAWDILSGGIR